MAGESTLHLALLPYLAFGHMIPFLQLAIALADIGHRISFICTPRNIRQLRPKVPRHLLPRLSFVSFPLPRLEGLPEQAEATNELSWEQCQLLKAAYNLLQDPIKLFLAESSPAWLIFDIIAPWAGRVAQECGVGRVFFSVLHPSAVAFHPPTALGRVRHWVTPECMTTKPDWIPFPSKVAFTLHEARSVHSIFVVADAAAAGRGEEVPELEYDVLAVRGCYENGGDYLELLPGIHPTPVLPVGLLPPAPDKESHARDDVYWGGVFRWLDEQQPRSVVFVSFGSDYRLTQAEVLGLASGLELSGLPFLWSLRKPLWLAGDDIDGALPAGFLDRTRGRGVVAVGWAPQLEILAHPSVGGFLFHSGWGSIVEALRYGHVLVLMPFVFDQGLNARFLVETGLGVEVDRAEDGSFTGVDVARALTTAMVSDEGAALRGKAREAAPVFSDQLLHDEYVKKFADHLLAARSKSDAQSLPG